MIATLMGRAGGGPSIGTSFQRQSRRSPRAIASSASRASRTVRVCGPCTAISTPPTGRPFLAAVGLKEGMRANPVRKPTTPLQ